MKKYLYSAPTLFYLTIKTATFPQSLLTLLINWAGRVRHNTYSGWNSVFLMRSSPFFHPPASIILTAFVLAAKGRRMKSSKTEGIKRQWRAEIWMEMWMMFSTPGWLHATRISVNFSLICFTSFASSSSRSRRKKCVNFNWHFFPFTAAISCWCRWQLFSLLSRRPNELLLCWMLNVAELKKVEKC